MKCRPCPSSFQHHSLTFPAMSNVPDGPSPFRLPTVTGPLPLKLLTRRISAEFSIGVLNPAAARQWNAVGSFFPANAAYAAASYQLTPDTGKSAWPAGNAPNSQVAGPGRPVLSRNSAIAASHDSVRPSSANGIVQ